MQILISMCTTKSKLFQALDIFSEEHTVHRKRSLPKGVYSLILKGFPIKLQASRLQEDNRKQYHHLRSISVICIYLSCRKNKN